jgi:hypothetical protein
MSRFPVYPYIALIRSRQLLKSGGWRALIDALPPKPSEKSSPGSAATSEGAIDPGVQAIADRCARAARQLPLRTMCLERSFGTCSTLRRYGMPALFCVGVSRNPPMRFHAWVEMDGQVLNDAQSVRNDFRIMCVF